METAAPVGSFPSPYEVGTPPGCEGWEELYPYYALFDEDRREADEKRFWFWNSMHFPLPMPAFDAICIDTAYQALGTWQNRVFAVPPAMGIDYRCLNGYIYISGNPVTDPEKKARSGITCFAVDLKSAGVLLDRQWPAMMGEPPWQLVFDNVRVPKANVSGEVAAAFRSRRNESARAESAAMALVPWALRGALSK